MTTKDKTGEWGAIFELPNVAIHVTLLPSGKVLCWGRRENPFDPDANTLNERRTLPFILDVATNKSVSIEGPKLATGNTVNLFCSGHCIRADGGVVVVGGHIEDSHGEVQSCVFDGKSWSPGPLPNAGRWYPSVMTLSDGSILAFSGSAKDVINQVPEIWSSGANTNTDKWSQVIHPPDPPSQYPRLFHAPDGRIFVAGPQEVSQFLGLEGLSQTVGVAQQTPLATWTIDNKLKRVAKWRLEGSSVTYDNGKIIWTGGGNAIIKNAEGKDVAEGPPTNVAEIIDLSSSKLEWRPAASMNFPRRQHNATALPDGTVLVTGGTKGVKFNDLTAGKPVHIPELWNPTSDRWTELAPEIDDRCYHSIALLLPSGKVLSAGGGESKDDRGRNVSLKSAQIFSPPYLFSGNDPAQRPVVSEVPLAVTHAKQFDVSVTSNGPVVKASWIRLGSVTHCQNMNQAFATQVVKQGSNNKVKIKVPVNPGFTSKGQTNDAGYGPPGHYMLFLLNDKGVPSEASIVRIDRDPGAERNAAPQRNIHARMANQVPTSLHDLNDKIIAEQDKHPVVIGITPVCPYGLAPCWAGASAGLHAIGDIGVVQPVANQADSLAYVYLKEDIIPDLDVWRKEFSDVAHGSYVLRGIEMTVLGEVRKRTADHEHAELLMASTASRGELLLLPYQDSSKIDWNMSTQSSKPATEAELGQYKELLALIEERAGAAKVEVIGTIRKEGPERFCLDVRAFNLVE